MSLPPLPTGFVNLMVDTFIRPKVEQFNKGREVKKALEQHYFNSKFEEYLNRIYKKCSYVHIITFQNQQKLLKDIYVPLTLGRANQLENENDSKKEEILVVDSYKHDFISKYKKILITDTAGMGKSTLIKFLLLSCIEENKATPILIELRKLSGEKTILNFLYEEINSLDQKIDQNFILELIKQGDFLFLFDGYDEIRESEKEKVTAQIKDFINKAGNNYFVITSRPELSISSFLDFQKFIIKPLSKEEAVLLLSKYDNNGDISKQIINEINKQEIEQNISEFLKNPLLVSLLYRVYEYKHKIPLRENTFYRQVYDSLFECHDLTKDGPFKREKLSGLDIEDFHQVLRILAFLTTKTEEVELSKDKILKIILYISEKYCSNLEFKPSNFLKDLTLAVPLFIEEGNYYRWSHKSLRDYFAAQYIYQDSKDKQKDILTAMYKSANVSRYYHLLSLYYDIDYKSFEKVIIYQFLNDFFKFCENSYVPQNYKNISEDSLNLRKSICFGTNQMFFISGRSFGQMRIFAEQAVLETGRSADPIFGDYLVIGGDCFVSIASLYDDRYKTVLDLLKYKKHLLVSNEKIPEDVAENDCNIFIEGLDSNFIMDDPKLLINNPSIFDVVNEFLQFSIQYYVNYHYAINLKKDIEAKIKYESEDTSIIDGL